jgi:ribosomal protein L16 Arg81 hydroxylase
MIIEELLGPVPRAVFVEDHYLKLPFARAAGCRHLTALGSWEVVARLLAQPEADVLVGREGQRRKGSRPTSLDELRPLLAEGNTLGIRHAERHAPGLAELADRFRRDFQAPVDIHLYCTPAGQPGLGWHYDAEDVFVLQTEGSKEWLLRKNTVNPWPLVETLPTDMRHEREIMPVLRCTLLAGDWLYIPAGYWHRTQAGAESLSLSVGVLSASALDVFDFLRRHLLTSLRWRQRLPTSGEASPLPPDELLQCYRALFADLGEDLKDLLGQEEVVRSFLKDRKRRFAQAVSEPSLPRLRD